MSAITQSESTAETIDDYAAETDSGLFLMFDREIPGSAGSRVLMLQILDSDDKYIVGIADPSGSPVAAYLNLSRADALQAFNHPFANAEIPSVFGGR